MLVVKKTSCLSVQADSMSIFIELTSHFGSIPVFHDLGRVDPSWSGERLHQAWARGVFNF